MTGTGRIPAPADAGKPLSTPLGVEVTLARKTDHETIASPNVVGVLRGSDPELADEYVVYTAHLDHVGTGVPVNGDTIYNGMYDNAMGSSILIETAHAFAAMPGPPKSWPACARRGRCSTRMAACASSTGRSTCPGTIPRTGIPIW